MYLPAFLGLAVSGASDWVWILFLFLFLLKLSPVLRYYFPLQLDGYVARKMGINSVVGSYLDPLADKVIMEFLASAPSTLSIWLIN